MPKVASRLLLKWKKCLLQNCIFPGKPTVPKMRFHKNPFAEKCSTITARNFSYEDRGVANFKVIYWVRSSKFPSQFSTVFCKRGNWNTSLGRCKKAAWNFQLQPKKDKDSFRLWVGERFDTFSNGIRQIENEIKKFETDSKGGKYLRFLNGLHIKSALLWSCLA